MEENKQTIKVFDENGLEKEYDVIAYFTLDSTGKDYILYTDNKEDSDGNVLVSASAVNKDGENVELLDIEDQNVLNEITEIIKELMKEEE